MFRIRLVNGPAATLSHPFYLVNWSRPVMFGVQQKMPVVSAVDRPLTWVRRISAERVTAEINSQPGEWTYEVVDA